MTIYILDKDPVKCAAVLEDKFLIRMIRNLSDVLSAVHESENSLDPWVQWAKECRGNMRFLWELLSKCLIEYHCRFIRPCGGLVEVMPSRNIPSKNTERHFHFKHNNILNWSRRMGSVLPVFTNLSSESRTPFPLVMPSKYFITPPIVLNGATIREVCAIKSYNNFYNKKIKRLVAKYDCPPDSKCGKCSRGRVKWTHGDRSAIATGE